MIRRNIKNKIKDFFLINIDRKVTFRKLEKELKIGLPTIIKYTKELIKEDIVKKIHIENNIFYTSNINSPEFKFQKIIYNLKIFKKSGIIDFINTNYGNPTIILFGSYANGSDTKDSDIDIYIEINEKIEVNLKEFEQKLQKEIQIFLSNNISKISNIHLRNSIINGITLNGFLEVYNE